MTSDTIEVSGVVPATPERLFQAWLDAEEHGRMTGGSAQIEPRVGGRHSAWDGYIQGRNMVLEDGRRIVQTWRASDFPEGAAESTLEVLFEEVPHGTEVLIRHRDLPEGTGPEYESGWREHYLEPMARYFAALEEATEESFEETTEAPAKKAPRPAKAAKAKKKAPVRQARGAAPKAAGKTAPKARSGVKKQKAAPRRGTAKKAGTARVTRKATKAKKQGPGGRSAGRRTRK